MYKYDYDYWDPAGMHFSNSCEVSDYLAAVRHISKRLNWNQEHVIIFELQNFDIERLLGSTSELMKVYPPKTPEYVYKSSAKKEIAEYEKVLKDKIKEQGVALPPDYLQRMRRLIGLDVNKMIEERRAMAKQYSTVVIAIYRFLKDIYQTQEAFSLSFLARIKGARKEKWYAVGCSSVNNSYTEGGCAFQSVDASYGAIMRGLYITS